MTFGLCAAFLSIFITSYGTWLVYIREVKPHVFTVGTWFIVSFIVCATMMSIGETSAALRNGIMSFLLFVTLMLCFRNDLRYIKVFDVVSFVFALASIPVWILMQHKEFSLLWLALIEILGVAPTIRKAWVLPYELNPKIYLATSLAIFFQYLSLKHPSLVLSVYFLFFCSVFFAIGSILLWRRGQVTSFSIKWGASIIKQHTWPWIRFFRA